MRIPGCPKSSIPLKPLRDQQVAYSFCAFRGARKAVSLLKSSWEASSSSVVPSQGLCNVGCPESQTPLRSLRKPQVCYSVCAFWEYPEILIPLNPCEAHRWKCVGSEAGLPYPEGVVDVYWGGAYQLANPDPLGQDWLGITKWCLPSEWLAWIPCSPSHN